MQAYVPAVDFEFAALNLGKPTALPRNAGFYFAPLTFMENAFQVQLPECELKAPLLNDSVQNADLVFDRKKETVLWEWCEQLLFACQNKIYEKRAQWFVNELTLEDIESRFAPMTKVYQLGKWVLMRVGVQTSGAQKCLAYDSNGFGLDLTDLTPKLPFVPLLHVKGVRFSENSFELVLHVSQILVTGTLPTKTLRLLTPKGLEPKKVVELQVENAVALQGPAPVPQETAKEQVEQVQVQKAQVEQVQAEQQVQVEQVQAEQQVQQVQEQRDQQAQQNQQVQRDQQAQAEQAQVQAQAEQHTQPDRQSSPLEEFVIDLESLKLMEPVKLKAHRQVYYDLYKNAQLKAQRLKEKAFRAYLTAKNIKTKYNLPEIKKNPVPAQDFNKSVDFTQGVGNSASALDEEEDLNDEDDEDDEDDVDDEDDEDVDDEDEDDVDDEDLDDEDLDDEDDVDDEDLDVNDEELDDLDVDDEDLDDVNENEDFLQ